MSVQSSSNTQRFPWNLTGSQMTEQLTSCHSIFCDRARVKIIPNLKRQMKQKSDFQILCQFELLEGLLLTSRNYDLLEVNLINGGAA
ncbi:hypothetical protein CFP56_020071 [Quercus suber]|uniref:Uncharacterized protein n=1 Tax=Quercus suber TaxID=58331 RepID=A0AAW0KHQ4_QUESU